MTLAGFEEVRGSIFALTAERAETDERLNKLITAQGETDDRLNKMIIVVERHVSEGRRG